MLRSDGTPAIAEGYEGYRVGIMSLLGNLVNLRSVVRLGINGGSALH